VLDNITGLAAAQRFGTDMSASRTMRLISATLANRGCASGKEASGIAFLTFSARPETFSPQMDTMVLRVIALSKSLSSFFSINPINAGRTGFLEGLQLHAVESSTDQYRER